MLYCLGSTCKKVLLRQSSRTGFKNLLRASPKDRPTTTCSSTLSALKKIRIVPFPELKISGKWGLKVSSKASGERDNIRSTLSSLEELRLSWRNLKIHEELERSVWVAPENFNHGAMLLKIFDRLFNFGILAVAAYINIKDVFPILLLTWAGFNLRKVYGKGLKRSECRNECSWLIIYREEYRGAVLLRRLAFLFT